MRPVRIGSLVLLLWMSLVLFLLPSGKAKEKAPSAPDRPDQWIGKIWKDHPRLFVNKDTLEELRKRAGSEAEEGAALLQKLKQQDARVADSPAAPADYGCQAAASAFLYLLTKDDACRTKAERLLQASIDHYRACDAAGKEVDWYSFSRINALAAYDWLHDTLAPAVRRKMAVDLLEHVKRIQADVKYGYGGKEGNPPQGYRQESLMWYAGLATFGDDLPGDYQRLTREFLEKGHLLNHRLLDYRNEAAGDDGGMGTVTLAYACAAYPFAIFTFFHTWESATGEKIADRWPGIALFPNYAHWNWLPGGLEFGAGDSFHSDNKFWQTDMYLHMSHILHFYSESHPEEALLAERIRRGLSSKGYRLEVWPYLPFLLTPKVPDEKYEPVPSLPQARHFEKLGQVLMRSGTGPDDTYALFMTGGIKQQHGHWDANHFGIYKRGFLALDTGSRPENKGPDCQHLAQYFGRTVAHNCVLIHMPGEGFEDWWSWQGVGPGHLPPHNDGGQNGPLPPSKTLAFETCPEYTYVASDATPRYTAQKCDLSLRQFVFVPPDHFVILDRVTARKPDLKKSWLLHTAREPVFHPGQKGDPPLFHADQGKGRLFCQTLLPKNAKIEAVGGPGKQFWSGGRNWPIPENWQGLGPTGELFGQWRVEVSPPQAQKEDLFLHVLEAADPTVEKMAEVSLVERSGQVGVKLLYRGQETTVLFGKAGSPSGQIEIRRDGKEVLKRKLSNTVQPQAGVGGKDPAAKGSRK